MREVTDISDEMRATRTFDLGDGRRLRVEVADIAHYGLKAILQDHGIEMNSAPVPVFQRGERIGTVPADFDPFSIRSTSFFYEPRGGDFVRKSDGWHAHRMLGPGDLEAIPGFTWGNPDRRL